MAHAWKACWVKALGGSNPPSSAQRHENGPSTEGPFSFQDYSDGGGVASGPNSTHSPAVHS